MKISNIEHRATSELVPYAGNARTHPEHQIEGLIRNIEEFGFYNPILINENGIIIAGHGRVMAAERMGLETVPTITIEGLTDQQRRALTLADNKLASHAGYDLEKVRDEIAALTNEDYDISYTGYLDHEIEALLRDDKFVLPPDYEPQLVPVIHQASLPIGGGNSAPKQPNVSDDNYSRFDLVMRHESKLELIDVLNEIKSDMMFEKLEDALMELVKFWKENR
jgi:hypothetical protein